MDSLRSNRSIGIDGDVATKARPVDDLIPIIDDGFLDGEYWIRVHLLKPNEYDKVKTVPKAFGYKGRVYAFSSWNSDTGVVAYKTGIPLAKVGR